MLERIAKLREIIPDDSCAVLITSDINRFYYSGFKSSAGTMFITKNTATLLVDFRYYEAALKNACSTIDVQCYTKVIDSINSLVIKNDIKSIIIEDADVTVSDLNFYNEGIQAQIITDFKLSDKILDFRVIKTKDEIECIKKAQLIAEKSYLELLNFINVGVTEKRLALELEYLMKKNGAQGLAFDIISVAGKNTSLPHGVPSDYKLKNGDFITFDFGCVVNGYHSDMTRTVALGYALDDMREIYDIVLKAHLKATENIVCGNTCADVDNASRNFITEKGYGECFGHTTGHGVGLEIHEKPTVYKTNNTALKTDSIITVEPGIYLPDKFGVRIEDMYLVTDNGFEDLASIDKELLIL